MKLLFLCTHNRCRSIIAEAIARQQGGDRLQVASAGSHPAGEVHPLALYYLSRGGIPTVGLRSKSWHDLGEFAPEVVITVCDDAAGEACPLWPGDPVKGHWPLEDPSRLAAGEAVMDAAFERLLGELRRRIDALLDSPLETLTRAELQALVTSLGENHGTV